MERAEEKDFVIVRSDGNPVFHLVNVVDDITMDWACAHTEEVAKTAHTKARQVMEDGKVMKVLLEQKHGQPGCVQPAGRG